MFKGIYSELIERFGGKSETIQIRSEIDSDETVTETYTPESGFAYFPISLVIGDIKNGVFLFSAKYDGTFLSKEVTIDSAFKRAQNVYNLEMFLPVYKSIEYKIGNQGSVANDFELFERGLLIPINRANDFVKMRSRAFDSTVNTLSELKRIKEDVNKIFQILPKKGVLLSEGEGEYSGDPYFVEESELLQG